MTDEAETPSGRAKERLARLKDRRAGPDESSPPRTVRVTEEWEDLLLSLEPIFEDVDFADPAVINMDSLKARHPRKYLLELSESLCEFGTAVMILAGRVHEAGRTASE